MSPITRFRPILDRQRNTGSSREDRLEVDNEEQGPLLKQGPSRPTVNLFMCRLDTAFIYCFYLFIGQLG